MFAHAYRFVWPGPAARNLLFTDGMPWRSAMMTRLVPLAAALLVACGGAGLDGPRAAEERQAVRAPAPPDADVAPAVEDAPKPSFDLDDAEIALLDPRTAWHGRSVALLVVETRQLDTLLKATDPAAADSTHAPAPAGRG